VIICLMFTEKRPKERRDGGKPMGAKEVQVMGEGKEEKGPYIAFFSSRKEYFRGEEHGKRGSL